MGKQQRPTYAEILQKRAGDLFVGRNAEREAFRRNFALDVPEYLIFWVHGLAGIGKSFLVGRFREIAREYRAPTALTNEAEAEALREQSIVNAMGRLALELKEAGTPLAGFEKRYEKYRECMLEIKADPDAPRRAFELFGRTAAHVALGVAKVTPAGAVVGELLAGSAVEEGLVDQAGQWAEYVARRFTNKDEVALVKRPVETLTPLFVEGVNHLAEAQTRMQFVPGVPCGLGRGRANSSA